MSEDVQAVLSSIRTVDDMTEVFSDEARCRRLVEAMVWPNGRICPACGYKRSIAIVGRDMGKRRVRPGLYQCSNGDCRFQFTATSHTPLHATKLPLSVWLKGMWFILQSDKGMSSVRLAEALGVSQPTAWRMGHALRLMVAREQMLEGTVEVDHFFIGGQPKKRRGDPPPGKGRKGLKKTRKGRETTRTSWSRLPPALQLPNVFRAVIGRQIRRTLDGGITIKSHVAVFG